MFLYSFVRIQCLSEKFADRQTFQTGITQFARHEAAYFLPSLSAFISTNKELLLIPSAATHGVT